MAIETDDDRAIFFDPNDFGDVASITMPDSSVRDVNCIFEARHLTKGLKQNNQYSYNAGQDVSGNKPEFWAREVDLVGVKAGLAVQIGGVGYTVYDLKPDSTGMIIVRLMRA